jgi:hypothetical protein
MKTLIATTFNSVHAATMRGLDRLRTSNDTGDVPAIIWMIGVAIAVAAVVLVVVAVLNSKADILTTL